MLQKAAPRSRTTDEERIGGLVEQPKQHLFLTTVDLNPWCWLWILSLLKLALERGIYLPNFPFGGVLKVAVGGRVMEHISYCSIGSVRGVGPISS